MYGDGSNPSYLLVAVCENHIGTISDSDYKQNNIFFKYRDSGTFFQKQRESVPLLLMKTNLKKQLKCK